MTENITSVDGVAPPAPEPVAKAAPAKKPPVKIDPYMASVRRWKIIIPLFGGMIYFGYLLWCGVLMALLPDPTARLQPLVSTGVGSAVVGAVIIGSIGFIAIHRIGSSQVNPVIRQRSLITVIAVLLPGVIASIAMPMLILREPVIAMDIIKPTVAQDFVAPVEVTYSMRKTIDILEQRGMRATKYIWDLNGDGKQDEETVVPELTVTYDRENVYTVAARVNFANGMIRRSSRRIIIRQAVFSVQPTRPIIERPTLFDISNLIKDTSTIKEVQWDFNNDGQIDETVTTPQVSFTYYKLGPTVVNATVAFTNNTQARYQRNIEVVEPAPLAFPATLTTEPTFLISPAPFGVKFKVSTEEPIANVVWNFADGEVGEGIEVAHTFEKRGNYPVNVKIRSRTGSFVELTALVRVVETLNLSDLRFDGSPAISGDKIVGEVPLTISLKPKTAMPFVQFFWEAPDATELGSTNESVQAIYRRPGIYLLTMVAKDAEDRVLRRNFTVEVKDRSNDVQFMMRPESGVAPLKIAVDASESFVPGQEITGYEWSFGDRSNRQTGSARAEHVFTEPGTYVVELTVRTVDNAEYKTSQTLVVRPAQISPCFTQSRTTLRAGGGVRFDSSCSSGKWDSLQWDFGDGTQTDERNPVHIFDKPGAYTVVLKLRDGLSRESVTNVTITVTE